MAVIKALWGRAWAYVLVVGAVLAGLFAARQSGKAAARMEAAAQINKQADAADKEARDVHIQTAGMSDDAIAAELKSDWVRGPKSGR